MNGDFKTDITRDSFQQRKRFSRVIMQQGRVQLDADWNEQTDILLHYMRTFTSDMIGPHAGPKNDIGFAIAKYTPPTTTSTKTTKGKANKQADQSEDAYTVVVQKGRYYVDGILCELNEDIKHYTIEDEEVTAATQTPSNRDFTRFQYAFLFYLDVWEREVTYQEDDSIREVALGGPDTATRAQIICQVRTKAALSLAQLIVGYAALKGLLDNPDALPEQLTEAWTDFIHDYAQMFPAITSASSGNPQGVGPALLKARTLIPEEDEYTDPCTVPPTSAYRGPENQLYRVEVHSSGTAYPNPNQPQKSSGSARQQTSSRQTKAKQGDSEPPTGTATETPYATFKWSRENGSVVFPITSTIAPGIVNTLTITVSGLGRDDNRFSLNVDDWVEIVEYEDTLELEPGNLLRVTSVDYTTMQVNLAAPPNQAGFDTDSNPNKPLLLRRWDYSGMNSGAKGATTPADDGALEIIENHWLTLEDGIQVLFHRDVDQSSTQGTDIDADDQPPYYHTGDYWLIPARTALGDIEWPHHGNEHEALPAHGIKHHYAPLAYVKFNSDGLQVANLIDLRRYIIQGWETIKL